MKTSKIYYSRNILHDVNENNDFLRSVYTVKNSSQLVFFALKKDEVYNQLPYDKPNSQFIRVESGNGILTVKYSPKKIEKTKITKGFGVIIPKGVKFELKAESELKGYVLFSGRALQSNEIIKTGTMEGPSVTGIVCKDNIEMMYKDDQPYELDNLIYIKWNYYNETKDEFNQDKRFTCYDKDALIKFTTQENSIMTQWVQNPDARKMNAQGYGGMGTNTTYFYKLVGSVNTWIDLESYVKLLFGFDKFIATQSKDYTLVGNIYSEFTVSGIHGQSPGERIFHLEPVDPNPELLKEFQQKYEQLKQIQIDIIHTKLNELKQLLRWLNQKHGKDYFFSELVTLKEIILISSVGNEIEAVPKGIVYLKNLEQLILTNLGLTEFPKDVLKLNLIALNLSNNSIKSIPAEITELSEVIDLNISNNDIEELPEEITQLTNLQTLNIGGNPLKTIPDLSNLTSLKSIYLNNLWLAKVPDFICDLNLDEELVLNDNEIEEFPECNLKVKYIYLQNNRLKTLPESIINDDLISLNVDGNRNLILPEKIKEFLINKEKQGVESDKLSIILEWLIEKGFSDLVDSLEQSESQLKEATELDLAGKGIENLPDEFEVLTNLEKINLSHNDFTKFPKVLTKLPNLKTINISNNLLTKLPKSLKNLVNLEIINLSGNKFQQFPQVLIELPNLQDIYLNRNYFTAYTSVPINFLNNLRVTIYHDNLLPLPEIPTTPETRSRFVVSQSETPEGSPEVQMRPRRLFGNSEPEEQEVNRTLNFDEEP